MTQQFVQPCSKDSDEEEEYDVGECTEVHDQVRYSRPELMVVC